MFLGISTSGNSANIIKALETARSRGLTTVALLVRQGWWQGKKSSGRFYRGAL
ncbi:SIS domain-containing protein [Patescibacteria group bacterium]|nr:MAG: SIS domain-containing protein [Patescibacteria group bacterium]